MQLDEVIGKIAEIQARVSASLPKVPRPYFSSISLQDRRSLLMIGPRGVGKTSFLLREASQHTNILYMSADHPLISAIPLWDIGERAFLTGFSGIIIDEIHFAVDWSRHLKSLYDSFPQKKIWASDSSSVILRHGSADLSRRFPLIRVPLLSLREYIVLRTGVELEPFDPLTAPAESFEQALAKCDILMHFRDYMLEGTRPIFIEGDYQNRILNIMDKMMMTDVPFFVPAIQDNYIRLMKAIMGHLALAPVPTVNVDTLCGEWGIGKDKFYQLLSVMEEVGLITIVRQAKDHKAGGKGAKIFFADPTMYRALNGNLGNLREALVVSSFKQLGKTIFAADKEQDGDFVIEGKLVEVGGRNKKGKKANYVIRDDIERPFSNGIPLWSMGMMY